MEKPRYIVGVDPDVYKSGVAVLETRTGTFEIIQALNIIEFISLVGGKMLSLALRYGGTSNVVFVIEDSDSTTNWHLPPGTSPRAAAAIGHGAGLCHATQRHLEEIAKSVHFQVILHSPLKKSWMGRDGKITQEEITQFMPGLPKKLNQECRDAALLAWNYAGLPIHIPPGFYAAMRKK